MDLSERFGVSMRTLAVTLLAIFLFGSLPSRVIASDTVLFQKDYWYNDGIEIPVWQRVNQYIELERSFNATRNKSEFQERTYRVKPLLKNIHPDQISAQKKHRLSPIYQTSPNPDAPRIVLTGNIIVHFPVNWVGQQVADFMSRYEMDDGTKLPLGKNIYIFQSEIVASSLALANAIYQSGKVIAAYPDWMVLELAY